MASRNRLRDWGQPAPRSAELTAAVTADPEPARRPPGRKDTRQWCRGKEGRTHQRMIRFSPPVFDRSRPIITCAWSCWGGSDEVFWRCHHQEACEACGKIIRSDLPVGECPAYPGTPEQKATAEAELARAQWAMWQAGRRPAVNGPQGYRRRR